MHGLHFAVNQNDDLIISMSCWNHHNSIGISASSSLNIRKNSVFSLLQNAGKLARSSPNFGELPQNNLCGQVAPSPRVDLACEKGTEGLCVWIFHQLLFGQVGPSKSDPHTVCPPASTGFFFRCCMGSGRVKSLTWWTTSWFRMLFLAQRLHQAMLPSL